MKLINTYAALFLTNMFTGANAFNIFFFRQFFLSIPKDLENAAIIDGCTRLGVFFRIVLPNAKPAIATTAILSFRSVWNAFLWPMLVINDYDKLTLTVGLKYLKEWEPNWAVLLAGASLSIVPIVIVFLIFQWRINMKKSISKVLSLVLALAFVFSLAACGGAPSSAPAASGSAPASGSEPAAPADPTTLKVYTWWDVTKFEHLQKIRYHSQQIRRYNGHKAGRRRDPRRDDAGHGPGAPLCAERYAASAGRFGQPGV